MENKKIVRTNKEIVDMLVDVADCCGSETYCPFINKCDCTETTCREIWEKWLNGTLNVENKETTTSEIETDELIDKYIEETNKTINPFRIMKFESGNYGLSLSLCGDYCQSVFNKYAKLNGEKEKNIYGLYTHGSGYEWEKIFRHIFKYENKFETIEFDSENGGFYCYCNNVSTLGELAINFKKICENKNELLEYIRKALN